MKPGWQVFEHDVQEMFGLDSTICSGNKWYDQGDAVTRGRDSLFPMFCDCKYTERRSRTLSLKELLQLENLAADAGKRMVMPIRFQPKDVGHADYAVVLLHDLKELLDIVRANGHGL